MIQVHKTLSLLPINPKPAGAKERTHQRYQTYEEQVSVLEGLSLKEDMIPKKIDDVDIHDLVGNYLTAQDVREMKHLKQPVNSTVAIKSKKYGVASGIVVNHSDRKYLVTCSHVLLDALYKKLDTFEVAQLVNGNNCSLSLNEMRMVYPTIRTINERFPIGDMTVFEYEGELGGIPVEMEVNPLAQPTPAFAIGYPGYLNKHWQVGSPLVSFGFAQTEAEREKSVPSWFSVVKSLPKADEIKLQLQRILFSGIAISGNSGGPLVNLNGNLLGIFSGSPGMFYPKHVVAFYPVSEIFQRLSSI